MTTYLCAAPLGLNKRRISFETTCAATLREGGLASPICAAFSSGLAPLRPNDTILLCYPRSPRALLAAVQNDASPDLLRGTFVSHGLASVGFFGAPETTEAALATFRTLIDGYESWPLSGGVLDIDDVTEDQPPLSFDPASAANEVPTDELPIDAKHHVDEFNATMAVVWQRVAHYAPELRVAFESLERRTTSITERIKSIAARPVSLDTVRGHHYFISALLEINAGLSTVLSQSLGRPRPKLLFSDYPVGQLSLLGIGGFLRGVWRFYAHLEHHFSAANHGNRARKFLNGVGPFDPFLDRQVTDYQAWDSSKARFTQLSDSDDHKRRIHLVHLSSRFGFHETAATLGASWQTLHFSATKRWSLLTMTHEFLHSHVREITSAIFPRETDYQHVCDLLSGDAACQDARESLQLAFISSVQWLLAVRSNLEKAGQHVNYLGLLAYNDSPNPEQLRVMLSDGLRYVQEIVVHVLDYLYCFGSDDANYISSIWHSWSTVPSVTERLHEYVLRTICSLAALSSPEQVDAPPVFDDAARRLETLLSDASATGDEPVMAMALEYLRDADSRDRLDAEFDVAYYVVRLTMAFFYDEGLAYALRTDPATVVDEDGLRTGYPFGAGNYPDGRVQSPLQFLSSRLQGYPASPTVSTEFESLWQVLLLVEGDEVW